MTEPDNQVDKSKESNLVDIPEEGALTVEEWTKEFELLSKHPPQAGAYLITASGEEVRLEVNLQEGSPPFIFGRAYIPQNIGDKLGWFAQGVSSDKNYGWKCILTHKSRAELTKIKGLSDKIIGVKRLRIVRESTSGQSLLVEVDEF